MDLFKTFTLTWWQTGLFKAGMLAIGIAVGCYWPGFFRRYLPVLVVIAIITLAYVTYVWAKQ